MLICEMASYFKNQGKTLVDVMNDIYNEYGYYLDALDNFTFKGIDGSDKISALMDGLRKNAPTAAGDIKVAKVEDFQSAEMKAEGFPSSNVLKFKMEDGSWVAVRPSGTEPKCKFYYSIVAENEEKAKVKLAIMRETFEANCK